MPANITSHVKDNRHALNIGTLEQSALASKEAWRFAAGAPAFWQPILGSASQRRRVLAPSVDWSRILFVRVDNDIAGYLQFYLHGKGPHAPSYSDIKREFGAGSAWWRYIAYQLLQYRFRRFEAYAYRLIVKENFRGGGIGRHLMQAWLDMLKAQGVNKVHLEAWAHNPRAIAFYNGLGFRVVRGLGSYLPSRWLSKHRLVKMVYRC